MSNDFIRVGDDVCRGGKVQTHSLTMKFDGPYVARKGETDGADSILNDG